MNFFDILLAKKLENDQDPTVEGLTVTKNGSYSEQGVVYDVVNVELPLDSKTITQNGTYDASDDDLEGYSSVNVNLPLATKSITANGNYKASDDNLEGFSEVDVNVPLPSNAYLKKSVSSLPQPIASFTDGSDNVLTDLVVDIEPVQSGSGEPSPSNIRPISGWTGAKVVSDGKNFFNTDFDDTTINGTVITKQSDGRVTTTNTPSAPFEFVIGHMKLKKGSYILNGCPSGGGSNIYRLQVTDYPVVTNLGLDTGNGVSFTLEKDMEIALRIQVYVNAPASLEYKPMIRRAIESDDTFTSYNGHTYTIPFTDSQGQSVEVFGGSVDVVNGGENPSKFVKIELQDVASNYWNKSSSYAGGFYFNCNYLGLKTNTPFVCSHAKTVTSVSEYESGTCYCDNSVNIRIMDGSATTNDWVDYLNNQKLANTPVTICAELATPTTFYTQPTAVKSVEGENNASANTGDVESCGYWSKTE